MYLKATPLTHISHRDLTAAKSLKFLFLTFWCTHILQQEGAIKFRVAWEITDLRDAAFKVHIAALHVYVLPSFGDTREESDWSKCR